MKEPQQGLNAWISRFQAILFNVYSVSPVDLGMGIPEMKIAYTGGYSPTREVKRLGKKYDLPGQADFDKAVMIVCPVCKGNKKQFIQGVGWCGPPCSICGGSGKAPWS